MAGKKLTNVNLGDLIKQVPKNQMKKFQKFSKLTAQYQNRVDSLPPNLPIIDWEYYRNNVRKESLDTVHHFQTRYEKLRKVFTTRFEMLDLTHYYVDIEKQKKEVEKMVEEYIKKSNKNIKKIEQDIENIKARVPYDKMTMEEFFELVPEKNPLLPCCDRKTFWPFIPEEQKPGPAGEDFAKSKDKLKDEEKKAKGSKK